MGGYSNERGVALAIVLVMTVVFGITAFGLLYMAVNRAQQSQFMGEDRLRAKYAAEAGLVKVMSRLFESPGDPGPWVYPFDSDNDGANDMTINVTRTNAGSFAKLQSKVSW